MKSELYSIWNSTNGSIGSLIQKLGYSYCVNDQQKDILVMGLNPFAKRELMNFRDVGYSWEDITENYSDRTYYSRVRNVLCNSIFEVDLLDDSSYADLFYFMSDDSVGTLNTLMETIDGWDFLTKQLNVTYRLLEDCIRPKVIIATSWEVLQFFGFINLEGETPYMGYDLELVGQTISGYKIYEIKGMDKTSTFFTNGDLETNLLGTYIIVCPNISTGIYSKEDKMLEAWEIKHYLDQTENQARVVEEKELYELNLRFRYPFLFYNDKENLKYGLSYQQRNICDLKSFRTKTTKEVIAFGIETLKEVDLFTTKDIDLLSDFEYCKNEFGSDSTILYKIANTKRFDKNYYEGLITFRNKNCLIHNNLPEEVRELFIDWYVDKLYI